MEKRERALKSAYDFCGGYSACSIFQNQSCAYKVFNRLAEGAFTVFLLYNIIYSIFK